MLLKEPSRYYLFSLSNFIAAFGGGTILSKGMGVVKSTYIPNDSVLAFFIGTVLGLLFIGLIPKKWSIFLTQLFALGCGCTSIILLIIYRNYAVNAQLNETVGIIFFLLLSIRFGLWFYSRVMRASAAASQQQSLAWVEFGYYLGMALGLIIWKLLSFNINLTSALALDALFQLSVVFLDWRAHKLPIMTSSASTSAPLFKKYEAYSSMWCWRLAGAVVALTVGVQVIIFNLAHAMSETMGGYILALFYMGVAIAAFTNHRYKIYMTWSNINTATLRSAESKIQCNFFILFLLAIGAMVFILHAKHDWQVGGGVLLASFIYEVVSLALLDRLGYEEKQLKQNGIIMRTYGLMSLSAALSLWGLGLLSHSKTTLFCMLLVCLSTSLFFIVKRPGINRDEKILIQVN